MTNEIDMVNHPPHYTSGDAVCPSCLVSIECISVTRSMNFNVGNAVKYLWRHKHKNGIQDLEKAIWYINNEIDRLRGK